MPGRRPPKRFAARTVLAPASRPRLRRPMPRRSGRLLLPLLRGAQVRREQGLHLMLRVDAGWPHDAARDRARTPVSPLLSVRLLRRRRCVHAPRDRGQPHHRALQSRVVSKRLEARGDPPGWRQCSRPDADRTRRALLALCQHRRRRGIQGRRGVACSPPSLSSGHGSLILATRSFPTCGARVRPAARSSTRAAA